MSLLGGASLHFRGRRVELNNRKATALVGYLALAPEHRDTRERIVGLLWSETDEAKARATLRQVLRELRSIFEHCGYGGFSTERNEIGFKPSTVLLDVSSALESVTAGRPHEVLLDRTRVTETLLLGYEDVDPSFRVWLLVTRENLRRRLIRGLEDQLAGKAWAPDEMRRLAEALIQLDPTHEGAYQALMRSHTDAGDISSALSAYKKLWDLLDDEYGMEPSDKTQKLVSEIKSGDYTPPSGPVRLHESSAPALPGNLAQVPVEASAVQAGGLPPKLALVVEPFDCEGVPTDKRYMALGFRYELISRLVRFREWALVDGGSHSGAVRPNSSLPHYRITGNLFQDRNALNATLTLQVAETGVVIWSERYSLSLPDFFPTQQQILHGLATTLNVHVSAERLARTASAPDVSLDIYDRWLRAQALISHYRPSNHERAAQILESIVSTEPNFAPAYSSLVQLENSWHIVFPGVYRTIARHHRALSLARTAATLDPLDSRAHLCLAWSHAMNGQFEMAVASFRHARTLNEHDPWTTTSAALGLAYSHELEEALAFADRAIELGPLATPIHWCYQSTVRLLCGDDAGSVGAAERAGDAINYFLGWRAAVLAHAGRLAEAEVEGRRFVNVIRSVWAGATEPSDETVARWLLHCFPFRREEGRERLRQGLELAGVPAPSQWERQVQWAIV
ncbi:MAG TPA: BTAD domain-containing putative transcriptional regulator [Beijerinckiaceae bacterium]